MKKINLKNNNLIRIGWIIGIYLILVLILYLVVDYKVKWEDKDINTYLYFYNCSGDLCTSTNEQEYYYGSVVCKNKICPYIKEKYNEYLILKNNKQEFLYNYKKDKIISDKYLTYKISHDNNYIVSDKDNKYSVIDINNKTVLNPTNKKIIDYYKGYVLYKEDDLYGIYNEEKKINIKPTYEEIKLINNTIYAYLEDNKYYIATYDTEIPIDNRNYDYIEPINENAILVINNKQLDILDQSLISKLLLKISCKYTYDREEERASLNIKKENNFVYFNILNDNDEYITYMYDIKNSKLHN